MGHVVLGQQKEAQLVILNEGPGTLRLDDIRLTSSGSQFALSPLSVLPSLAGTVTLTDGGLVIDDNLNVDGGRL